MDTIKILFTLSLVLILAAPVGGLRIHYNTTHPYQFIGPASFENLGETRVIFRAEPINIHAGESTNLNFVIENPNDEDHLVTVTLREIPPGFTTDVPDMRIESLVQSNSTNLIAFRLNAPNGTKARTWWYGFDVVDRSLDENGSVKNISQYTGTYHGFNVVEPETEEPDTSSEYNETSEQMIEKKVKKPTVQWVVVAVILVGVVILVFLINKMKNRGV